MFDVFCEKALNFINREPQNDAFINLLIGAIRSGKTGGMIPKLLFKLNTYKIPGEKVITGVSKDTIYHNVLNDLFECVGPGGYRYNRNTGELVLGKTRWRVVGAKDEGSEKYIRGATIGLAYSDETTLMPQSFFQMLIGRMSPDGARFYGTTNPDIPTHWLKKDYIDNPEMRANGDVWVEHFTLDDNPGLSEKKREQYRRMYKGVFYERYILGKWVIAEGAIYKDSWSEENLFDDTSMPLGLLNPGGHVERYIACDYGTTNQCVFLDIVDDGTTLWVVREYVWDSASRYRQKTDREYADDLESFLKPAFVQLDCVSGTSLVGSGVFGEVIVDPSAASFKAELLQRGIFHTDANNEVLDGIRVTASLMAQKKLKIHRECRNLVSQLQTYAWNDKAAKRGEEEPLKVNDHGPDAIRYGIHTKIPAWRLAA